MTHTSNYAVMKHYKTNFQKRIILITNAKYKHYFGYLRDDIKSNRKLSTGCEIIAIYFGYLSSI